jgi:hypothetical protein
MLRVATPKRTTNNTEKRTGNTITNKNIDGKFFNFYTVAYK